jgi:hypothetical protein
MSVSPSSSATSGDAKGQSESYVTIDNSMVIGGGSSLTKRDTGFNPSAGSSNLLTIGLVAIAVLAIGLQLRK